MVARLRLAAHLSAAALVLLGPRSGFAYLEPSDVILENVAAVRAKAAFKNLVAEGYLPSDMQTKVWTAVLANRAIRTERRRPDGTEVDLLAGKERYVFTRGGPVPPPSPVYVSPMLELLGSTREDPGGRRSRALLAKMRIDSEVVSIALYEGRPTYIIGALPRDLGRPQLWVDQERYVPVRWITRRGGAFEDVRLSGYHQATTGPWFPETIEVWLGDQLESRVVYTNARLNASLDPRLFAAPTSR